ncbi:MAG: hypothetical protein WD972_01675, partial [Candidatus Andersenbacteria bacterium]
AFQRKKWHLALSNSSLGNPHRPDNLYRVVLVCEKNNGAHSLRSIPWPENFLYPTRPRIPVTISEACQRQSELQATLHAIPLTVTLEESESQLLNYLVRRDQWGTLPLREWGVDYALKGTLLVTANLPQRPFTFPKLQVPLYPLLFD